MSNTYRVQLVKVNELNSIEHPAAHICYSRNAAKQFAEKYAPIYTKYIANVFCGNNPIGSYSSGRWAWYKPS